MFCSGVSVRGRAICGNSRDARRMGPATRCGKYATNNAKSIRLDSGGISLRYTSITYAERHERVERNTHGEDNVQRHRVEVPPCERKHPCEAIGKEIEVLEKAQNAEVVNQADDEREAAFVR